ncbi:MAG: (Fe-S)-binding protein [Candidatus Symbiobacter sp.]|nr:(Fe-S)-binding protein [Candidatus Symbiobacter sp.]
MSLANPPPPPTPPQPKHVALFLTCLVDMLRPSIGMAALTLLEKSEQNGIKFTVMVPGGQICCGQPAYNGGDRAAAMRFAQAMIAKFEAFDYIVVPSGSCGGMIKCHYPILLGNDPIWGERATKLAAKTYELTQFLHDECDRHPPPTASSPSLPGQRIAYHSSCSSLREMKVKNQPIDLLRQKLGFDGVGVENLPDAESCCGFGGLFSAKFPDISAAMADAKIAACDKNGADLLVACDLGCLLHLGGRMGRVGKKVTVRHVAEILADNYTDPSLNPLG